MTATTFRFRLWQYVIMRRGRVVIVRDFWLN